MCAGASCSTSRICSLVRVETTDRLGIREVSEQTGMSLDTLRWYEREGLIPAVERTPDGRRRYGPAAVRFIKLIQALRRTGMPVADVRDFVTLGPGTPGNALRRLEVLQRQEARLLAQIASLDTDLALMRAKMTDYQGMIAEGRDCEDYD
jgi:DNA-binding transcriptional MerR regulator